jgi:dTDP-4-dehydrorhamnose 3,5-epimerase
LSRFLVYDLPLSGLKVIERKPIGDERGSLCRIFCADELERIGWQKQISQINNSITEKAGTVRGLHFQHSPYSEMKLVSCLRGRVWDVAVDVRADSSTFLKWYAVELSSENNKALLIPEGFAHGFQALSDGSQLLYLHSSMHVPDSEGALNPRDPFLGINWPLDISTISLRDSGHVMLQDYEFRGV